MSIIQGLKALAKSSNSDFLFGIAQRDYTVHQALYPSEGSLIYFYVEEAAPGALAINNSRASIPHLMIANSGLQRFDLYAGPFTTDDQFSTLSIANKWLYIPDGNFSVANQVLFALKQARANHHRSTEELERHAQEMYAKGYIDERFRAWLDEMDKRGGRERRAA